MATVVSVSQLPQSANSGLLPADAVEAFVYVVTLSEPDAANGARLARDAAGIPAVNDALGTTGLIALRKRAEPESGDDSGINYRVTVDFGINVASGSGGAEPWNRKDRIRRTVQSYQIYKSCDRDGTAIANSAGDPIQGGLLFEDFNPVRIVNRYRKASQFNPELAEACIGTINQASVNLYPQPGVVIIPAKSALLRGFTCNDAVWPATNEFYYDITLELEIELEVPLEFYYVANKGYFYLDGGERKPYMKSIVTNGIPAWVSGETFLYTDGTPKDASTYKGYDNDTKDPWYDLQFRRRKIKDWSNWMT